MLIGTGFSKKNRKNIPYQESYIILVYYSSRNYKYVFTFKYFLLTKEYFLENLMFGLAKSHKQGLQLEPNLSLLVLPSLDSEQSLYTIGIQVNSKNYDSVTNQMVKITDTSNIIELSLDVVGFENLISISSDLKTVSGKVFINIKRLTKENTTTEEKLEISDAKYSVYPTKAATKKSNAVWDSAKEIQNLINEIWQDEFGYALEDFHESIGNDFANPNNSPTPKLKRATGPVTKSTDTNKKWYSFDKTNFIAACAILLSICMLGYGYLLKPTSNSNAVEIEQANNVEPISDVPTNDQVIIPDQNDVATEAQTFETETLNDFGLEAGVNLDQ
jgi:hypothetical protein